MLVTSMTNCQFKKIHIEGLEELEFEGGVIGLDGGATLELYDADFEDIDSLYEIYNNDFSSSSPSDPPYALLPNCTWDHALGSDYSITSNDPDWTSTCKQGPNPNRASTPPTSQPCNTFKCWSESPLYGGISITIICILLFIIIGLILRDQREMLYNAYKNYKVAKYLKKILCK